MAEGLDTGLSFKYPDLPEIPLSIKLAQEKEATGLYFSGHPLDSYREHIEDISHEEIISLGDEEKASERKFINIVGIVNSLTIKTTRNGEKMAFFMLGDRYGEIECIAFSRTYVQVSRFINEDAALCVNGTLQIRDDESVKLIVSGVKPLQKNGEYHPSVEKANSEAPKNEEKKQSFGGVSQVAKKIYLRVPTIDSTEFAHAKNLVEIFEGVVEVIFYDNSTKQYKSSGLGFDATEYTVKQLKNVLGDENVVIK
jgi:DNA polymerase-3 subunit alpha